MTQQNIWSPELDNALRYYFEEEKIRKWSQLSQHLTSIYKIRGLTGKKCKKRYLALFPSKNNASLHTSINLMEDAQINELHSQVGNKWSAISKLINESNKMVERSHNDVKNYFYSKMRKALRKVNKFLGEYDQDFKKPIRESTIFKIIELTQQRFNKKSQISEELIQMSLQMKNWLYKFLDSETNYNTETQIKEFYEQVNILLSDSKKAPKIKNQIPRSVIKAPMPTLQKISRKKDILFSDGIEIEESIQLNFKSEQLMKNQSEGQHSTIQSLKRTTSLSFGSNNLQEVLQEAGILQYQEDPKGNSRGERQNLKNYFLIESLENYQLPLRPHNSLYQSFSLFRSS